MEIESVTDKFRRKFQEDPLVPIGAAGLQSMRNGQSMKAQLMMRGRVFAQSATIAVLLIGALKSFNKPPPVEVKNPTLESSTFDSTIQDESLKKIADEEVRKTLSEDQTK